MRRATAALTAALIFAAGCGGGEEVAPEEPAAAAPAATTRGRPAPTQPTLPPEPAPFVEDTVPPVEDLLLVEDEAPVTEDTATAAEDTPDDAAPFVEDETEPPAPEPAPEPATTTAPLPTAPPAPPAGPQEAPDDADTDPEVPDAGAEPTEVVHVIGGLIRMSDILTPGENGLYCGVSHSGLTSCPPVEVLEQWCVWGDPPVPWTPGEWVTRVWGDDPERHYYLVTGIAPADPPDRWPRKYHATYLHYRQEYPTSDLPAPEDDIPDPSADGAEDNAQLYEISDGLYARHAPSCEGLS